MCVYFNPPYQTYQDRKKILHGDQKTKKGLEALLVPPKRIGTGTGNKQQLKEATVLSWKSITIEEVF